MNTFGKVYIVGAGCGSYDLITLRGKNLIERCSVIVYDSLIDTSLLDFAPDSAERICVGKRAGRHSEAQENINNLLIDKAREGNTVVRLKGGDPFVFGRGGEEISALQKNNIEYAVVPGISSAIAVPELAGIPVTHRRSSRSFHVITGHTADDMLPENMSAYASLDGTLVFLMGLKNLKRIAKSLIKNGKDESTPAAVISNGAIADQRVVRGGLKDIAAIAEEQNLKAPAVIVIGEVAKFDFSQTVVMPLENITVTVTGTKKFANKLSSRLSDWGANVKRLDYLNVIEYRDNKRFDDALMNFENYSWIVLTSINGAEIFFSRLNKLKIDIRKLAKIKFAVIGSGTARILENHGIFADIIPESYTSKALANKLAEMVSKGERILILRARQGSEELTEILDENNMSFDDIKTYDVQSGIVNSDDKEIDTDFITFASSSGVNTFFESGYRISAKTKIVCIGNITANTLRKHNIKDFQICDKSNIEGISDTILREVQNEEIQTTEIKQSDSQTGSRNTHK